MRLISLEELSSTFDESLFNIEDSSKPPMDAVIHVDPSRFAIKGSSNYQRIGFIGFISIPIPTLRHGS